ncbi:MAG: hypothetical protein IKH69_03585 [Bacteroidaceae bacterium]|nr:hypothetical protein [Bacteroidaceae bacterium]
MKGMPETVNNPRGTGVNVCCASCLYKMLDRRGCRICALTSGKIKQLSVCKHWRMREDLIKIKKLKN